MDLNLKKVPGRLARDFLFAMTTRNHPAKYRGKERNTIPAKKILPMCLRG